ncbi:hypothetical protein UQ20_26750, partial [Escherichia coli]
MARFDIDTGGYPVQRRTKITRAGFNLPDIRNPRFREPELKLYRRIINRKMRRGGYLKKTPGPLFPLFNTDGAAEKKRGGKRCGRRIKNKKTQNNRIS